MELISKDNNFLRLIHEREDLNKRIAENDTFDLNKDYIKEYEITLEKFFQLSEKLKAKFTSFLLEKLLKDKEELLNEIMKEYKECKKYN